MTGTIQSLWRYPVKSMSGEELAVVHVSSRGLAGDRAYALVDKRTNTVGSAKNARRFGELLKWRVRFSYPPENGQLPPVMMTMPGGRTLNSANAETAEALAKIFGENVSLESAAPEGLRMEIAAGTLGGKFASTTEVPISGGAPAGTFYNYAPVHIITTSTLRELQKACPTGEIAVQRFRPNIIVEHPDAGFVENHWVGREVAVGSEVRLRVTIPCPRCVVPTLPRENLNLDPAILRTISERNRVNLGDYGDLPCIGVYAEVICEGNIQRGDTVQLSG